MRDALTKVLIVLVIVAQAIAGRGTGGGLVICLGGGETLSDSHAACSHAVPAGDSIPLVPLDSHEHDCDCLDVPSAASLRAEAGSSHHTVDFNALAAASFAGPSMDPQGLGPARLSTHPPGACGLPIGLRTVRLLI